MRLYEESLPIAVNLYFAPRRVAYKKGYDFDYVYFLIKVDGEALDGALRSSHKNVYTAVLFYASWCPFSRRMRSTFDVLSSMFPQIGHLAVEQSAAMPSVFSRYGVHSTPSLLLVSQTKVRHHGPKDLDSLVRFYKKVTGVEPIEYLTENQGQEFSEKPLLEFLDGSSRKDIVVREPCLVFAVLFLSLRAFLYFFPSLLFRFKAFWALYIPRLNLEIFGETSQLLGRVGQMVDVKRVWTKVKLFKARNFPKGAKNARVWASSLASVSLGESSSTRPSTSLSS
ncbi:5'-adenylylsulfate reductase-like [Thalictrum thalictroides]|uniref:5'-adenylylsulfate reductase-like n=1 Tax=Thalictrum thalictroides TaxID=46969 RepID=A0A7J6V8P7_THATH|nr:5'-adenylylsulfate reductase-like [Thalictrum thalictroides]